MNITWVRACFGNYFFRFFLDLLPGGVCSLAGPPWWYFLAW